MEKLNASAVITRDKPWSAIAKKSILFSIVMFGLTLSKGWSNKLTAIADHSDLMKETQQTITGTVTDEAGTPIPGVTVLVVDTNNGTTTDFDGNYRISANDGDQLRFSYLGFASQTVTVGSSTSINIILVQSAAALEEVVVIGYGTRKKKDLTGAISTIGTEEITKEVVMTPELAMQGKMAGVFVSNPGSDPNARPQILIRGASTFNFADPLYVIDGVPITEGFSTSGDPRDNTLRGNVNIMNLINPNDIESISVLKDASAAAIYGVRASNGVILIETKRGRAGRLNINLSSTFGVQSHNKRYDVLNTQEYVDLYNEAWQNNTAITREDDAFGSLYDSASPSYLGNSPTYNWMDEAVRSATVQDYAVSINGGSEKSNFALGVGYSKQEDVVFAGEFERYSFNINSDHNIKPWLKMGQSFRMVHTRSKDEPGVGITDASLINPWQPLFDPNGVDGFNIPTEEISPGTFERRYGNSTRSNFLGQALYSWDRRNLYRTLGSVYAEVKPLKNFRIRGTFSGDYYTNRSTVFTLPEGGLFAFGNGELDGNGTSIQFRTSENLNIVGELLFGYNNTFGKHNLDVIANLSDQRYYFDVYSQSAIQTGITSFSQRRIQEGLPPENLTSFAERNVRGLLGYMGRVSYHYDSKYYLDVTVRRDGSSNFGPGYKWGTFPSINGAWRVSSESFMQGVSWLNDLKLRAGWGEIGNQETRPFNFLSTANFNPVYPTGNAGEPGLGNRNSGVIFGDFPIEDTSWETVATTNIGFDAVMFDNKLSLTAEYYARNTSGILQGIQIPLVIGAQNRPVVNLATVENTGVEFQLGYNDTIGELGFGFTGNLTTNRNRVSDLYNNIPQSALGGRVENNFPLGYIYGYVTDGIFQTQAEVDAYLASTESPGNTAQLAPGDFKFRDIFSPPNDDSEEFAYREWGADGIVNNLDQDRIGKTIPGFFYGFALNLDYKGFDAGFTFRGLGDVQRVNNVRRSGESMLTGGVNQLATVRNRWTPTNPSNTFPRAIAADPSGNNRFSNRWVEDANFLRLQNMQFGYTFSQNLLADMHLNNARVFLSFSNVFVLTPFTGLDPENDSTPSTVSIGFNIGF